YVGEKVSGWKLADSAVRRGVEWRLFTCLRTVLRWLFTRAHVYTRLDILLAVEDLVGEFTPASSWGWPSVDPAVTQAIIRLGGLSMSVWLHADSEDEEALRHALRDFATVHASVSEPTLWHAIRGLEGEHRIRGEIGVLLLAVSLRQGELDSSVQCYRSKM